jgi:anti-anti-sigma regulatory factor
MADSAPDAPRSGEFSRAPLVRTERGLGLPHQPVTVVFLHGEHDFGSRGLVADALEPIDGDVLVDLSWCTFVDSSVIALILGKHAALESAGHTLEIILPPSHGHLTRTFDRLGARTVVPIRDAPPPAAPDR